MPKASSYTRTLLAGLLLLAGCSEANNVVGADSPGSLSFTFNGSQTFDAVGRYTGPAGVQDEFAAARRVDSAEGTYLEILAVDVTGPYRVNELLMTAPDAEGEHTCTVSTAICVSRALSLGHAGGGIFPRRVKSGGRIHITELSRTRVKGTFSFPSADPLYEPIDNGRFDVPILAGNAR